MINHSACWSQVDHGRDLDTPLFRTGRLRVEHYRSASQRRALAADPDVRRFSCWPDSDDASFQASIATMMGRTLQDGGGWFNLAVLLHDGTYVGDHAVLVEGLVAKLGVAFLPVARGRGMAGEVVVGSMGWLRRVGVTRFRAEIDPDNAASLALFERNGFTRMRLERDDLGPFWVLERP